MSEMCQNCEHWKGKCTATFASETYIKLLYISWGWQAKLNRVPAVLNRPDWDGKDCNDKTYIDLINEKHSEL